MEKRTLEHRRELRRNPTDAERRLWQYLCRRQMLGAKFRRQHPVGPYIADFACPEKKLIVELDGAQHLDQIKLDAARTAFLLEKGYRVLRFWNHHVFQETQAVLRAIEAALDAPLAGPRAPLPSPPPRSSPRGSAAEGGM